MTTKKFDVQSFRDTYKAKQLKKFYYGYAHLAFTLSLGLAVIFYTTQFLNLPLPMDFLALPVAFILGNLVEYLGHRYLLHINHPITKEFYREHTLTHHFYFTHDAIVIETHKDLHRVLFPWFGIVFFVGLIGMPIAWGLSLIFGKNFGLLFFMMEVAYFLLYEICHTICHFEDSHPVFVIPGMRGLKEHHRMHHHLELMADKNFSIVLPFFYPLFDKLFKSQYTSES